MVKQVKTYRTTALVIVGLWLIVTIVQIQIKFHLRNKCARVF